MRAVGNRHARRRQVAVDRSGVANVDLLGGGDVPVHFALNDHGFREHLRLDLRVRADRQDVLAQLDLALDLTFDRQVFAAAQLALDDDALADIHHVPL